ncbi:hypothetical protein O6H91_15G002600 [Diphasiastrum complanatum]|uniref:Uncharacterized protein n=1 Tax=Diphasiastrum complanatum TaxID=34168 RepID=A0ACC2BFB1_DIPCM|nr:hypothetical protein O6H91_15G002600 [Diphasiastrum complanatum]
MIQSVQNQMNFLICQSTIVRLIRGICTRITRSAPYQGPIKDHIQWQNRKSDTGCSVSSYKINDREEAVLSTNGVSMSVPPTEERTALEAETSRQRSQHIINGQLQFSSSDKAGNIASTGPCRSGLVDANCNGVSTGRLAPSRVDLNGALQHSHALVGTGGIKKSKKRSRASRRPPTTILEADSANFRSMVQQLTGFPSSPFLSDLLPRRGSQLLGFDARSQVRPSHGLGGQNISGIFADMPAFHSFRQPLIPKALNNCIYGDILSRTEAPSIRHVRGEGDPSISFDVKPTTMGIADGSSLTDVLVNHSCSMSQKQSLKYSDMASLFQAYLLLLAQLLQQNHA